MKESTVHIIVSVVSIAVIVVPAILLSSGGDELTRLQVLYLKYYVPIALTLNLIISIVIGQIYKRKKS